MSFRYKPSHEMFAGYRFLKFERDLMADIAGITVSHDVDSWARTEDRLETILVNPVIGLTPAGYPTVREDQTERVMAAYAKKFANPDDSDYGMRIIYREGDSLPYHLELYSYKPQSAMPFQFARYELCTDSLEEALDRMCSLIDSEQLSPMTRATLKRAGGSPNHHYENHILKDYADKDAGLWA